MSAQRCGHLCGHLPVCHCTREGCRCHAFHDDAKCPARIAAELADAHRDPIAAYQQLPETGETAEEKVAWSLEAGVVYRARVAAALIRKQASVIGCLKAALNSDRTGLAAGLVAVIDRCKAGWWITEGRGSYEWDDERYRDETRTMLEAVVQIATAALRESGALVTVTFNGSLDRLTSEAASTSEAEGTDAPNVAPKVEL